jgi:hypothetical protein
MPVLPEEGIGLLQVAGITHDPEDDLRLADLLRQLQNCPTQAWYGRDPFHALLRSVGKRSDYGIHLIKLLAKQNNRAGVHAVLTVYAQRTSAQGVAEMVEALAEDRGLRPVIDEFLQVVVEQTPRPLAVQAPPELREIGRRREARVLADLLAAA